MPFGSLWLPVVVSAVAVWLLSALLHMALKYHRADYTRLPDEEAVGAALRKDAPPPGLYAIPYSIEPAEWKDPAVQERFRRGPVAMIAVMRSGPPAMGKSLAQWFLFCLLVSYITAYVARNALSPAVSGHVVMQITGAVSFVGYGFGALQHSIWYGIPWSNALRALIDAAIYSLLTAAIFWWLWPGV